MIKIKQIQERFFKLTTSAAPPLFQNYEDSNFCLTNTATSDMNTGLYKDRIGFHNQRQTINNVLCIYVFKFMTITRFQNKAIQILTIFIVHPNPKENYPHPLDIACIKTKTVIKYYSLTKFLTMK